VSAAARRTPSPDPSARRLVQVSRVTRIARHRAASRCRPQPQHRFAPFQADHMQVALRCHRNAINCSDFHSRPTALGNVRRAQRPQPRSSDQPIDAHRHGHVGSDRLPARTIHAALARPHARELPDRICRSQARERPFRAADGRPGPPWRHGLVPGHALPVRMKPSSP